MSPEVLTMSKMTWDKLTPEDQKAVKEAARESVAKMRALWTAQEKKSEETVRAAGAEIITIDKQPFIDAMAPVYAEYVKDEKSEGSGRPDPSHPVT